MDKNEYFDSKKLKNFRDSSDLKAEIVSVTIVDCEEELTSNSC